MEDPSEVRHTTSISSQRAFIPFQRYCKQLIGQISILHQLTGNTRNTYTCR
ncbi:unnamed protein product [Cylicostephanus goldi]|uniref:Uncharacterized protein n=1 Tax=Cylicostephanus goldi TaxID=71465 RepID=A0A3P6S1I8_CYLGO|nr:unnamed protein product [Cylicostephanus goldi]